MILNDEQRAALKKVLVAQLALWDALDEAEKVIGHDIDCADDITYLCSMLDTAEHAMAVSDGALIQAFGLRGVP